MYWYSDVYLNISDLLNDSFLCIALEKTLVFEFFFKFNKYVLQLQTNWMTLYW